ncbi:bifunctional Ubiquitin-conjugating enzyme-RWD-like/GIR2-like/RWD domain [Babesia duncani]|uniref:Bifunctional Ubiquitin-conjugating enzyme-RWD-like/GIR2-like/RWD domain n=1 Tax=Babesia duncani TaxID=323732 RepID=A0AAD9PH14_9APIC|nr:bifunctional Ubiquitin-conjugating enzyme-RWD-like/GIR2-like/RWD domain [Babesia duncani]KAK2194929.1 bifunctional Ubiquitin-conjugating enzyme-RWD-like/GIR2-like/RWD domain [Babesia duncani]KAK2198175.1 bifunctional Ubiquitin-conjugating enzyme-RWD-like/GIR2-like/RWD domain [Babesia duncani]
MSDLEREMELEALLAIFVEGEEIEIVDDNTIIIACNPNRYEADDSPNLKIRFELPQGYPLEESLGFVIFDEQGLDPREMAEINAVVEDTIVQNVGMPCMYAVVEAVNQWLLENEPETPESLDDDELREEDELEVDERYGSGGLQLKTLVPIENRVTEAEFMEWSREFRTEMIRNNKWRDVNANANKDQLTGKAFFMQAQNKSNDVNTLGGTEDVFWTNKSLYDDDF